MEKKKPFMGFLRYVAAVGLMGFAFLCGGTQANAATMKDMFDERYYADKYPDLKEEFGYEREALWQHFVQCGLSEGRSMNGFIDLVKYRDTYPDLNEEFGDDWDAYLNHYLTCGSKEGRRAGGGFDALDYEDLQIVYVGNSSNDRAEALEGSQLSGSVGLQVLPEDSYGAQWGLDHVDKPILRSREESLRRLSELGQENELMAEICRNSDRYSESMLMAVANNPEMAGFVSGYTGNSTQASAGFSEEELALEFPLFLQWDPRWGYVQYGDSCIGLAGCGPTCLSMALYYLTGDESITPDSVAAYSVANGHYVPGAGTAWKLLTELPSQYGVKVSEPGRSEQSLKYALDQGKIVICSMREGEFTARGHFIVIYGYDEEGFMINDPNCVARSMKRWAYGEFASQIKHVWTLGK